MKTPTNNEILKEKLQREIKQYSNDIEWIIKDNDLKNGVEELMQIRNLLADIYFMLDYDK